MKSSFSMSILLPANNLHVFCEKPSIRFSCCSCCFRCFYFQNRTETTKNRYRYIRFIRDDTRIHLKIGLIHIKYRTYMSGGASTTIPRNATRYGVGVDFSSKKKKSQKTDEKSLKCGIWSECVCV